MANVNVYYGYQVKSNVLQYSWFLCEVQSGKRYIKSLFMGVHKATAILEECAWTYELIVGKETPLQARLCVLGYTLKTL